MKKTLFLAAMLLLAATSFAQSLHSVAVTCTTPSSGGAVTGFNFYRATVSGGPYTVQNATPVATCSFTDTAGLAEGAKYFYIATAVGPGGESAASNEASALIPFQKPSPPSNLTAVPK